MAFLGLTFHDVLEKAPPVDRFDVSRLMRVARTPLAAKGARSIVEYAWGLPKALRVSEDWEYFEVRDGALPQKLSFWELESGWGPRISYRERFSMKALNELLQRFHKVRIHHSFEKFSLNVTLVVKDSGRFLHLNPDLSALSYQGHLRLMNGVSDLFQLQSTHRIGWKEPWFEFVFVSRESLQVDTRALRFETDKELLEGYERLRTLIDADPAFVSWEAGEQIDPEEYARETRMFKGLNGKFGCVMAGYYRDGFDPYRRPPRIPAGGIHYPLIQSNACEYRLNVVHYPDASYLEMMTELGIPKLKQLTKSLGGKWEIWSGEAVDRWNGDPKPIQVSPKAAAQEKWLGATDFDRSFRCFQTGRTLNFLLQPAPLPILGEREAAKVFKGVPWKLFRLHEKATLARTLLIQRDFGQVEERFGPPGENWDDLRFLWPIQAESDKQLEFFWKGQQYLKDLKSLPLTIGRKKHQVPLVFLRPIDPIS